MTLDLGIWDAYAAAIVTFDDGRGEHWSLSSAAPGSSGQWNLCRPFFAADTHEAWIVTASNPRSAELSPAENAHRRAALLREIEAIGCRSTPAVGQSPDGVWAEESFILHDPDAQWVADVAERYDQNAVFHWTKDAWTVRGILVEGQRTMGWNLVPGE
jgi:hypothetical protein